MINIKYHDHNININKDNNNIEIITIINTLVLYEKGN